MSEPQRPAAATLALHAGGNQACARSALPEPLPAANCFDPTAALEERIAALEGGVGAIATVSVESALLLAVLTLLKSGDHVVAAAAPESPFHHLLAHALPALGIRTTFVATEDASAWAEAIVPETRLLIAPALSSRLELADVPVLATVAHAHGIPLMVDASLLSPCLQRPLELGADLVVHAAELLLGGDGGAVAGILVDGGRFDWLAGRPFPLLTETSPGLPGRVFSEESPVAAFSLAARAHGLRALGCALPASLAAPLLQDLATLPLRVRTQASNAAALVRWLAAARPGDEIFHPALPQHHRHELANRLLPQGAGPLLALRLGGGAPAATAFLGALRLLRAARRCGGPRSLVLDPAPTIAAPGESAATEGQITLWVGLEDLDDIRDELERALRAADKAVKR